MAKIAFNIEGLNEAINDGIDIDAMILVDNFNIRATAEVVEAASSIKKYQNNGLKSKFNQLKESHMIGCIYRAHKHGFPPYIDTKIDWQLLLLMSLDIPTGASVIRCIEDLFDTQIYNLASDGVRKDIMIGEAKAAANADTVSKEVAESFKIDVNEILGFITTHAPTPENEKTLKNMINKAGEKVNFDPINNDKPEESGYDIDGIIERLFGKDAI